MRRHVLVYDSEAGAQLCTCRQPSGCYESIFLVLFLCILLVVTIVIIMENLAI